VIFGTLQYAFENSQVRYNTTCVEIFGAVEDNFITFRGDLEIAVARIDGAADKLFQNWSVSRLCVDTIR
jgi:hypothetical protein